MSDSEGAGFLPNINHGDERREESCKETKTAKNIRELFDEFTSWAA